MKSPPNFREIRIIEIKLETQFPEGDPIPFALHQERERLLSGPAPVAAGKTIAAVLHHYHASPKYRDLKPRTQKDYDQHTSYLKEKLGHLEPRHIERRHVIKWRDDWAKSETPHRANYRIRVLRLILEHAVDMGLLTVDGNPAKGVGAVKYEKQERVPWPAELIRDYRSNAKGRALLLFELCLGTGQRIGDILKMKWSDIDDGGIKVRQGKTGKPLWVPLTARLRAVLDAAPRRSIFILTNHQGTSAWSYRGASDAVMKVRRKIGAEDYDIHALRHTTASELAEAGADDDVIAAVTGQSKAMVIHYTKTVRQKVRALKAKEIRE